MRIIKAYTDAVAMGNQGFGMGTSSDDAKEKGQASTKIKNSGDSIRLSQEALRALESGGESLSACANDATYDQKGNITRQVDALRRDIDALSFIPYAPTIGMGAKLNSLRAQVGSLRASV